jgi:A/G-specific adenine glycosylase
MRPSTPRAEPTVASFRRRVLDWYVRNGRTFQWRTTPDPYGVLIAELLLQRTRADLVVPHYARFMAAYPDASALAAADRRRVLSLLKPLGFHHRSARLPNLAKELVERHAGSVPNSRTAMLALHGVGEYVANAVLLVAYHRRLALVDPNVIRLVGRYFGIQSRNPRPRTDRGLWEFVGSLVPARRATEFGLGLVDLGAVVCRTRRPLCDQCPLRLRCRAYATGRYHGSRSVA